MTGRRGTPPWIAIAADVAALVLGASATVLLLAGPYRKALGETIVSVGWEHAAFAGLAIAAIRHAALPTPSIRETIEAGIRFVSARRTEPYGRIAVFLDLEDNRWDLLGPSACQR